MIARLFYSLLFASLTAFAADEPPPAQAPEGKPAPASGLRKAMSEAAKGDAQKRRAPALSGKGLRRPIRRK
jgi:hypothetical protein